MRARGLLAALTLLAVLVREGAAIDAKCSACAAVAFELQVVLDEEKPRDPLDFRGRLDSKGERYGKVLDWRDSELRVLELLEGLCTRLNDYALWTPSEEYLTKNPGADASNQWVRVLGHDLHAEGSKEPALKGAKGKAHAREIFGYCGSLVESTEEQLSAAIRTDALNSTAATEKALCRTFTSHCRGIKRRKMTPAPPSPPPPLEEPQEGAAGEASEAETTMHEEL